MSDKHGYLVFFKKNGDRSQHYALYEGELRIGSNPGNEIRLKTDNPLLLGVHAVVSISVRGIATIINKSAEVPVIINDQPLSDSKILTDGDTFEILQKKFQYFNQYFTKETIENMEVNGHLNVTVPVKPSISRKSAMPAIRSSPKKSPPMLKTKTPIKKASRKASKLEGVQVIITPNNKPDKKSGSKTTSRIIVSKSLGSPLSKREKRLSLNEEPRSPKKGKMFSSRNVLLSKSTLNITISQTHEYSPILNSIEKELDQELPLYKTKSGRTPKKSQKLREIEEHTPFLNTPIKKRIQLLKGANCSTKKDTPPPVKGGNIMHQSVKNTKRFIKTLPSQDKGNVSVTFSPNSCKPGSILKKTDTPSKANQSVSFFQESSLEDDIENLVDQNTIQNFEEEANKSFPKFRRKSEDTSLIRRSNEFGNSKLIALDESTQKAPTPAARRRSTGNQLGRETEQFYLHLSDDSINMSNNSGTTQEIDFAHEELCEDNTEIAKQRSTGHQLGRETEQFYLHLSDDSINMSNNSGATQEIDFAHEELCEDNTEILDRNKTCNDSSIKIFNLDTQEIVKQTFADDSCRRSKSALDTPESKERNSRSKRRSKSVLETSSKTADFDSSQSRNRSVRTSRSLHETSKAADQSADSEIETLDNQNAMEGNTPARASMSKSINISNVSRGKSKSGRKSSIVPDEEEAFEDSTADAGLKMSADETGNENRRVSSRRSRSILEISSQTADSDPNPNNNGSVRTSRSLHETSTAADQSADSEIETLDNQIAMEGNTPARASMSKSFNISNVSRGKSKSGRKSSIVPDEEEAFKDSTADASLKMSADETGNENRRVSSRRSRSILGISSETADSDPNPINRSVRTSRSNENRRVSSRRSRSILEISSQTADSDPNPNNHGSVRTGRSLHETNTAANLSADSEVERPNNQIAMEGNTPARASMSKSINISNVSRGKSKSGRKSSIVPDEEEAFEDSTAGASLKMSADETGNENRRVSSRRSRSILEISSETADSDPNPNNNRSVRTSRSLHETNRAADLSADNEIETLDNQNAMEGNTPARASMSKSINISNVSRGKSKSGRKSSIVPDEEEAFEDSTADASLKMSTDETGNENRRVSSRRSRSILEISSETGDSDPNPINNRSVRTSRSNENRRVFSRRSRSILEISSQTADSDPNPNNNRSVRTSRSLHETNTAASLSADSEIERLNNQNAMEGNTPARASMSKSINISNVSREKSKSERKSNIVPDEEEVISLADVVLKTSGVENRRASSRTRKSKSLIGTSTQITQEEEYLSPIKSIRSSNEYPFSPTIEELSSSSVHTVSSQSFSSYIKMFNDVEDFVTKRRRRRSGNVACDSVFTDHPRKSNLSNESSKFEDSVSFTSTPFPKKTESSSEESEIINVTSISNDSSIEPKKSFRKERNLSTPLQPQTPEMNEQEDETPRSHIKPRRSSRTVYNPVIEDITPVTPEKMMLSQQKENTFKTPINTPGLFETIRKSAIRSRKRGRDSQVTNSNTKRPRVEFEDGNTTNESIEESKQNSPLNRLSDFQGVKQLMKSPQKSPKNDLRDVPDLRPIMNRRSIKNDLTNVPNLKRIMSPRNQNSPVNDLTNPIGVRNLMKTPRHHKAPLNELSDFEGVADIFNVSGVESLDIENYTTEDLFTKVSGKKTPRTYHSLSPRKVKGDVKEAIPIDNDVEITPAKAKKEVMKLVVESLEDLTPKQANIDGKYKDQVDDSPPKRITRRQRAIEDAVDNSAKRNTRREKIVVEIEEPVEIAPTEDIYNEEPNRKKPARERKPKVLDTEKNKVVDVSPAQKSTGTRGRKHVEKKPSTEIPATEEELNIKKKPVRGKKTKGLLLEESHDVDLSPSPGSTRARGHKPVELLVKEENKPVKAGKQADLSKEIVTPPEKPSTSRRKVQKVDSPALQPVETVAIEEINVKKELVTGKKFKKLDTKTDEEVGLSPAPRPKRIKGRKIVDEIPVGPLEEIIEERTGKQKDMANEQADTKKKPARVKKSVRVGKQNDLTTQNEDIEQASEEINEEELNMKKKPSRGKKLKSFLPEIDQVLLSSAPNSTRFRAGTHRDLATGNEGIETVDQVEDSPPKKMKRGPRATQKPVGNERIVNTGQEQGEDSPLVRRSKRKLKTEVETMADTPKEENKKKKPARGRKRKSLEMETPPQKPTRGRKKMEKFEETHKSTPEASGKPKRRVHFEEVIEKTPEGVRRSKRQRKVK